MAADLAATCGNAAVDAYAADMSSLAEVRRLSGEVLAAYPRLDVLVNNVGGFWASRHVTVDGLEHTFAVNHLAPFLLTALLLDGAQGRRVGAGCYSLLGRARPGPHRLQPAAAERSYSGSRAYSQSNLANVMFTYELARRLEGSGVTANVLHPGVVRTAFGAEDPPPWHRLVLPLIRPLLKTPARGADSSIYLASSMEVDGVTGRYFVNRKPGPAGTHTTPLPLPACGESASNWWGLPIAEGG